jgi:hypothetical protein
LEKLSAVRGLGFQTKSSIALPSDRVDRAGNAAFQWVKTLQPARQPILVLALPCAVLLLVEAFPVTILHMILQ